MFRVYDNPSDREINRQLYALRMLVREVEKNPPRPRVYGHGFQMFLDRDEEPERNDYGAILWRRQFWATCIASAVTAVFLAAALVGTALVLVNT